MKNGKRKALIIISWVLTGCLLLCSAGLVVLYKTGALYSAMLDYSVAGEVTPNAEKLCNALLSNDSLTFVEKARMMKLNQYFVDNKYIDCDRVCEKLATVTITENDPDLADEGISGAYYEDNSMTFATMRDRWTSLNHELCHSIQNEALPYGEYGWFVEGYNCLVVYEYFGNVSNNDNIMVKFVQCLCEIVGSDVLFQTDAKGDIDILKKALTDKGISEETVEEAFNIFYELWQSNSYGGTATDKEKVKAVRILVEMYDVANNYPEDIPESFYNVAYSIIYMSEASVYYFNSAEVSLGSISGSSSGTTDDFAYADEDYIDSAWSYRDDLLNFCDDIESGAFDEFMNS